ncbi:hypothetical protein TrVE_jg3011 [Triparma verrucosa]|uniref:Uncharacterized protein n=1 Tax=Triparma verrucosa TaxID=1606542 RepID=A0A9W7FJX2_9STRA|nr:hypothetical protein TrVE_jg3011 [Triparma verrucosa]
MPKPTPSPVSQQNVDTNTDTDNSNDEPKLLFKFYDSTPSRPTPPFSSFPNSDVPPSSFPSNSWQSDVVYLNHFIQESLQLIDRTLKGLGQEYNNTNLFKLTKLPPQTYSKLSHSNLPSTPLTTSTTSFTTLSTRLLHSLLTRSPLKITLTGHSSAAGHGNTFSQQSQSQACSILKPLFKLLNVDVECYNLSMGSFGTIQGSMAGEGVYGVSDIVLWDSMMTEDYPLLKEKGRVGPEFFKQGLVELFWTGFGRSHLGLFQEGCHGRWNLCEGLGEGPNDSTVFNARLEDLEVTKSIEEGMKMPKVVRFANCDDDINLKEECKRVKCEGVCWLDRDDGIFPAMKQREEPRGCVSWHPGWRYHKYRGRVLAYYVLMALRNGLEIWQTQTNQGDIPLDGKHWHLTPIYESFKSAPRSTSLCERTVWSVFDYPDESLYKGSRGSQRICKMRRHGITEYTPTRGESIGDRLVNVQKPKRKKELYEGPDEFVMDSNIVEVGDVDVVSLASGYDGIGRGGSGVGGKIRSSESRRLEQSTPEPPPESESNLPTVESLGWTYLRERVGPCDGSTSSTCNRDTDYECVLYGIHDGQGGFIATGPTEPLEIDLGEVVGGFLSIGGGSLPGDHILLGEIVEKSSNSVVGSRKIKYHHDADKNLDSSNDLPLSEDNDDRNLRGRELQRPNPNLRYPQLKVWNDPDAKDGEYIFRFSVLETTSEFRLNHVYWTKGEKE